MTSNGRSVLCTPPDDGTFLRAVSQAYGDAVSELPGEMPVLVWTLVLVRRQYPSAVITLLPPAAPGDSSGVVWLVARDGWTAAPRPTKSRRPQKEKAAAEAAAIAF